MLNTIESIVAHMVFDYEEGQVVLDSNLRIICTAVAMTNRHDFKLFKQSKLPIKKETLVCVYTGYFSKTS